MNKAHLYLIIGFLFLACNGIDQGNAAADQRSLHERKSLYDTVLVYATPDADTLTEYRKIRVENEYYSLCVKTYCLNDSSLVHYSLAKKSKTIYHAYQSDLFFSHKNDTILFARIHKSNFSDSLPQAFKQYGILKQLRFEALRSNRLYFKSLFWIPHTKQLMEAELGIFFRTNKKPGIVTYGYKEVANK